jgi:hypothetical protein
MIKPLLLLAALFFVASFRRDAAQADDLSRAAEGTPVAVLTERLGGDDPRIRQEAERQLASLGSSVVSELFEAAVSDDAERARRARRLIMQLDNDAIPELRRIVSRGESERAKRIGGLLVGGLTERLVRVDLEQLAEKVEAAAAAGKILDREKTSWVRSFRTATKSYNLDEAGELEPTVLTQKALARIAIPEQCLAELAIDPQKLNQFCETGEAPDPVFQAAWQRFSDLVGDGPEQRGLFADMLTHETQLLRAASLVFAEMNDRGSALPDDWTPRLSIGGLHDLRCEKFNLYFRELLQSSPRQPGKPNPPTLDEETIARFAALTFVDVELRPYLPASTLKTLSSFLRNGLYGFTGNTSPLFPIISSPKSDRDRALRTLFVRNLLTSDRERSGSWALFIAMIYRLEDVSNKLALRIAEQPADVYANEYAKSSGRLYAAHALLLFGNTDEHVAAARRLLEMDDQLRLSGVNLAVLDRTYIEAREMALKALLRMTKRQPSDIGGFDQVPARCPFKGSLKIDVIKDTDRWPEILRRVDNWLAQPSDTKQ